MSKQQKGFTIIEVVLVLAIAGLIFLMVFIALPALQRGQRDNQRRQDASRFMSQIASYATNNRNKVPAANSTEVSSFVTNYMKNEFNDPKTGNAYQIKYSGDPADGEVVYRTGQKCNGEAFASAPGTRNVALRMKLEGSGIYCQDNQ